MQHVSPDHCSESLSTTDGPRYQLPNYMNALKGEPRRLLGGAAPAWLLQLGCCRCHCRRRCCTAAGLLGGKVKIQLFLQSGQEFSIFVALKSWPAKVANTLGELLSPVMH